MAELNIRFGSVCSGIEAASVAWNPLGWRAAWLSEIEAFPSAVLSHHYPDVPNLGDMTTLPERIRSGEVEAPDVFCGGTPCQAFSVAGLRRSLDDARGNLSLTFCEIANAIDAVRLSGGEQPAVVFWENVPGVLNTKDNAFGCFLAGLAGEDDPLVPPGKKWSNAGCVYGPARAIAWRVLDAQYFGVAQRRRRVFVVASARKGFDPAAVLFEFDGVRRDTAPSREAGQAVAAHAARSVALRGREGGATAELGDELAGCLRASGGGGDKPHALAPIAAIPETTHTLRGEGFDASEDGTGRGTPLVPVSYAIQAGALRTNPTSGPDGIGVQSGLAYTLEARSEVQAVAFAQNSRNEVRLEGGDGQRCGALSTGGGKPGQGVPMIAFHPTQDPISSSDGSTHALGCGSTGGQASIAVATHMQVRRLTPVECERLQGFPDDYTLIPTTTVTHRKGCEFFGTKEVVTHGTDRMACGCKAKHKPADQCPDGPRYKALGNSWAVPNVRWIGRRIDAALRALDGSISAPSVL